MMKSFMFMQWKVSRWAIAVLTPLCLAAPILVTRFAQRNASGDFSEPALDMLRGTVVWLPIFPILAALTGFMFALAAWAWDHNTHHVYALSLPVERWKYALMKMASGALFMAIPIFAALVGAVIATSSVQLPEGLHGYPVSFGFRFLFAALIAYAAMFSMASGTIRTTIRIIVGLVLFFAFGSLFTELLSQAIGIHVPSPLSLLGQAFTEWPGPFNLFGGNWMLIDV